MKIYNHPRPQAPNGHHRSKEGLSPLAAAQLQRWAWILSAYKYDLEFQPTCERRNADGLSRLALKGVKPRETSSDPRIFNIAQMEALPVNVRQLRAATGSDPLLRCEVH